MKASIISLSSASFELCSLPRPGYLVGAVRTEDLSLLMRGREDARFPFVDVTFKAHRIERYMR